MLADKEKWNEKYLHFKAPTRVIEVLQNFYELAPNHKALDIACGKGRHSLFLRDQGFVVDAIDISEVGTKALVEEENICVGIHDLDNFIPQKQKYGLVLNAYYLNRRLFPYIKESLCEGGLFIAETFVEVEEEGFAMPSNRDNLLRKNELLCAFIDCEIVYYFERESVNTKGERVYIASLVAKKR